MRVRAAKLTKKKKIIEWRSHEPSRLETFSDAVFAFAVTLIIVSLEVPKTFGDLAETLKGTGSFAVCFTLLFLIWNNQNLFFRYFGLKDAWTATLNGALLFVVLVYVYPLKFLFNVALIKNSPQNISLITMSGTDPQLFIRKAMPKEFFCPVCLQILIEPIYCPNCRVIACASCLPKTYKTLFFFSPK